MYIYIPTASFWRYISHRQKWSQKMVVKQAKGQDQLALLRNHEEKLLTNSTKSAQKSPSKKYSSSSSSSSSSPEYLTKKPTQPPPPPQPLPPMILQVGCSYCCQSFDYQEPSKRKEVISLLTIWATIKKTGSLMNNLLLWVVMVIQQPGSYSMDTNNETRFNEKVIIIHWIAGCLITAWL